MPFARIYAKVSLGVAVLIALHGLLAFKFDHGVDNFTMVLSIVTVLWLVVSALAVVFFPEKRIPVWAPWAFIVYVVGSLALNVLMVTSFGRDEAHTVFSKLNHHRDPIYYGEMIFAAAFSLLNLLLLRLSTRAPAQAISTPQPVPVANVGDEPLPPPSQVAAEPQNAETAEQSTLNFAPESEHSVTITVAPKQAVEITSEQIAQVAAKIDLPAPPAAETNVELAPEEKAEEQKEEEQKEEEQEQEQEQEQNQEQDIEIEREEENRSEQQESKAPEEPDESAIEPVEDKQAEQLHEGTWEI